MKFEHRVEIPAPRQTVRAFLDDVPRSARCLPGLEELQPLEDGWYEGRVGMKVGPVGFHFTGKARLERESAHWRLNGEGRDRRVGAGVVAHVEASLSDLPAAAANGSAGTAVLIAAEMQFSGRLAELGQPLIKRKADSLVKEFAQNLQQALTAGDRT
ncbi:MAG TPA: SRPBCC domain-containing protein [Dehalococcoidia bacterium]